MSAGEFCTVKHLLITAMKIKIIAFLSMTILLWNCDERDVETSVYKLNSEQSIAEWKGYLKTGYFNEGTIAVKSENLTVRDGKLSGGTFAIPISSIVNVNLPTDELKQQLVHHLQSADFFNMALHPEVKFEITDVTTYSGTNDGGIAGANYQIKGSLTILGKTNPVSFPAKVTLAGDQLTAEGKLKFDRTLWGMTYATEETLPDENRIESLIDVHLKLSGTRK
jgi:polyisoprenoid-binding protein YceI